MSLKDTFLDAAETIFSVFDSLTHASVYVHKTGAGWEDEAPTEVNYPIDLILENFSQRDVQFLSFSELLQPTDLKGLVKGSQLPDELTTTDTVQITATGKKYTVIAWNTDPAGAVFTLLLRGV